MQARNFFVKLCLVVFLSIYGGVSTDAEPIPVFCLAGWIPACKDMGYDSITEYDTSFKELKSYSLSK